MSPINNVKDVRAMTKLHDEQNLAFINNALKSKRIDAAAHEYLTHIYKTIKLLP